MSTLRASLIAAALTLLPASAARADACPSDVHGGWTGELTLAPLFDIAIELERDDEGGYAADLTAAGRGDRPHVWQDRRGLRFQSDAFALTFEGRPSADGEHLDAFVAWASNLYRTTLRADGPDRWTVDWRPMPSVADPVVLDLFLEDDGEGGTGGYFFFRDPRLPSLYGLGAACTGRELRTRERNLGLEFHGRFDDELSSLTMAAIGTGSVSVVFRRMSADGAGPPAPGARDWTATSPALTGDGWPVAGPRDRVADVAPLAGLVDAIGRGEYPNTHAVLLATSGVLVFEEYFLGFDRNTLHDMRSASKSVTGALVGLAVDRELVGGADAPALAYFPEYRAYASWDRRKAGITVRDLLTMSSGLDANDSDRSSVAAEGAYQSQSTQPDWIRLALDAPMVADPGTRLVYGTANPMILGGVLANAVGDRVEWFAEETLFRPLGIDRYRIFMDPTGVPYMGGGMYMRPRDMLKFAQLHLDGGIWRGRRVLSEAWVDASFERYGRLEPLDRNGNEYGYLWWHERYEVGGRTVDTVEARGNGGQYVVVVPEFEAVAVITSGNYRGGLSMTRQPQRILERHLLPALLQ